jgi:protein TonB
MYADRYERSKPNPVSLTAAIGINAALVAALLLSTPEIIKTFDPPLKTYPVPEAPPPPPEPPAPRVKTEVTRDPLIVTPIPDILPPVPIENPVVSTSIIPPPSPYVPTPATGDPATPTPITPAPVLTDAAPLRGVVLQPEYPPTERRAGAEGAVTVRVLIGTDGRVKAVELVRTASDAFFDATRRYALSRWRFKPATRDGIPYESWRTMTVRFVLEE